MLEPKVNGGISGHLKYNPELTKALEMEIKRFEEIYPASIKIQLADITDKRWKTWKNYNGKEKTEKV